MHRKNDLLFKIVLSGMFIAVGLVLPFVTGQLQSLGNMLLPMHLPVMLCGFVLGWQYGAAVGFITPLLRGAVFGMPQLPFLAVPMAFELAVYGIVAGLLFRLLPKKTPFYFIELAAAMVAGRLVWAAVRAVMTLFNHPFGFEAFIVYGFVNAWPGILIQFLIVPASVALLSRAGLIRNTQKR